MRLLAVISAAMGYGLWESKAKSPLWRGLKCSPCKGVFPSVTCTAQAALRTGLPVSGHGVVGNGFFDRRLGRSLFWEQSSAICEGGRIWDSFRESGGKVGQICLQQSLGFDSDMALSPAPIHKHHGGMIEAFASKPAGLYERLCGKIGRKFSLMSYWGPFASVKSSRWIAAAAAEAMKEFPDGDCLLLVYLPHLDYDLQRHGVDSPKSDAAFREIETLLEGLLEAARLNRFEFMTVGDYAISNVSCAAFPNKELRDAGLLSVRDVGGMLYADLHGSKAFALCDHQIAHVYVREPSALPGLKGTLSRLEGVGKVWDCQEEPSLRHSNAGELLLEASDGWWFAYPWWDSAKEAPDYATHVDIHNKPGYDPCELFMALWPPFSVPQDVSRIGGSHGRSGDSVLLVTTMDIGCSSIESCASELKSLLSDGA